MSTVNHLESFIPIDAYEQVFSILDTISDEDKLQHTMDLDELIINNN